MDLSSGCFPCCPETTVGTWTGFLRMSVWIWCFPGCPETILGTLSTQSGIEMCFLGCPETTLGTPRRSWCHNLPCSIQLGLVSLPIGKTILHLFVRHPVFLPTFSLFSGMHASPQVTSLLLATLPVEIPLSSSIARSHCWRSNRPMWHSSSVMPMSPARAP